MAFETEDFLGELRLGRQLVTVRQVAARGLVVILGLAFLVPGRTTDLVGPVAAAASVLTYVVLGLTLLNILELLAGSSERGGTYTLVHETLSGLGGFFAGWSILAGNVALAAVLLKAAASHLALIFTELEPMVPYLALGLLTGLVVVQLFRLLPRRDLLWPGIVILLVGLGMSFGGILLQGDLQPIRMPSTFASDNFMRAAAWLAVSYAAVEAILASRRQIRDPDIHLPQGMLTSLVVGVLLFALLQALIARLPAPTSSMETTGLAEVVGSAGLLPSWVVFALAIAALMLAAHGCLMTSARQLHALSRQGVLPGALRRLRPPFRVQPLLFGALFLLAAPLILWMRMSWLLDISAGLFLVPMFLLNLAAMYSRRAEPERRRSLVLPFYPLIPGIALAISGAFLFALPLIGIVGSGAWLLLGLAVYLSYGHTHLMEAQEGVLVFGREPGREKPEGVYRILLPLGPGVERHLMLGLATSLARQTDGEVIALQVIPITDPLAIEEGRRIARERNTLFQWSTREAQRSGVPTFPVTRLARNVSEGILETADEEECDLLLLSWPIRSARPGMVMGPVIDPVVRRAPCDVAVVAFRPDQLARAEERRAAMEEEAGGDHTLDLHRILVPTAGGPHAPLATRLALLLAQEHGATTNAVYVAAPQASQVELAEGQARIQQTLASMREQMASLSEEGGRRVRLEDVPLESHVVTAESVVEGIAKAGAENDLVFIGASEESLIDQVLFGTVAEQVAQACPSPVVMVKRFRGLRRFWLQRTWDALFGALPTLTRQEQVEVYMQVRRGARPDVDFFIMIGLSAIIATYGLLQGSSAVIIGAMLVAPLFTPILALSLAIVQGDIRLLRLAVESALKGVALAIGLSVFLTALSPLRVVTHEISTRTHPNLFDLAVALASGAAGAYAVARKDVAAALPGVAIAAALVPPLGVIGIGFAMGNPGIAGGGSLLFITNLIAITLAGAVTLLLLGFRPTDRAEREARLRLGLVASLVLFVAITIPLGVVFVRSVQESRIRQTIDQMLVLQLGETPDYTLAEFEFEEHQGVYEVTVTVYAQSSISPSLAEATRDRLIQALGRPVRLHLKSIPIEEIKLLEP